MQTVKNGKVLLRVRPRGFCAGVVRAVDIVELALESGGRLPSAPQFALLRRFLRHARKAQEYRKMQHADRMLHRLHLSQCNGKSVTMDYLLL
jgi:hypothetical protein